MGVGRAGTSVRWSARCGRGVRVKGDRVKLAVATEAEEEKEAVVLKSKSISPSDEPSGGVESIPGRDLTSFR